MKTDFNSAIEARRSVYSLGKKVTVSPEKIEEVIGNAVKHVPSAFNSQSARVVVLFGANHQKSWDLTKDALRKIVPAENFGATEEKIDSFASAYGTVLFFEDNSVIESLQNNYPSYNDNFPIWSLQSAGMLQYVVWTALAVEGLGASLQHYNNLIESQVKAEWKLPASWQLLAQMPFGEIINEPGEKEFLPLTERLMVFK